MEQHTGLQLLLLIGLTMRIQLTLLMATTIFTSVTQWQAKLTIFSQSVYYLLPSDITTIDTAIQPIFVTPHPLLVVD